MMVTKYITLFISFLTSCDCRARFDPKICLLKCSKSDDLSHHSLQNAFFDEVAIFGMKAKF